MNLHNLGAGGVAVLVGAALFTVGLVVALHARTVTQDRYALRLAGVHRSAGLAGLEPAVGANDGGIWNMVGLLGRAVSSSGVLSKKTLEEFQQTLLVAGFTGRDALGMLIGGKLLLVTLLPAAGWLAMRQTSYGSLMKLGLPAALAIVGLMAPDVIIKRMRAKRIAALEAGLSDALDLLVICSEAGLGLEPGLERVGREIRVVHPAVAEELAHTSQEMRVNADRRVALINMGKRTGLDSLKRLGTTLVQSIQYGTPLSQALRVLSAELRQEAMNRFETKAGRLSVLLTIPMILFILPCVFMVMGGPAIIQVYQVFKHGAVP